MRPLDKYLSNTPNGSYNKINDNVNEEKCIKKQLNKINKIIDNKKEIRDNLIEELIKLIRSNSSKHKQFLKEKELEEIESVISDCVLVKKRIITNYTNISHNHNPIHHHQ